MYGLPFKNYTDSRRQNSAPAEHSKEKKIRQEIEKHENDILKLKEELKEVKSRKMFKCEHCDKRNPISKLTLIQPHWYESPYGCTGGDNWNASDEYLVFCPKCGGLTRVLAPNVPCNIHYDSSKVYKMKKDPTYMYGWIMENQKRFKETLQFYRKPKNVETTFDLIKQLRKEKREREERSFW